MKRPSAPFLCEHLCECGFLALGVESADNAIRLLDLGLAADLVFSDLRLPGKYDGFGLARWVAEHHPELPVILTTGDIGKENAGAMRGHAEMLPKPYELDRAVAKIHHAIKRHKSAPHRGAADFRTCPSRAAALRTPDRRPSPRHCGCR